MESSVRGMKKVRNPIFFLPNVCLGSPEKEKKFPCTPYCCPLWPQVKDQAEVLKGSVILPTTFVQNKN